MNDSTASDSWKKWTFAQFLHRLRVPFFSLQPHVLPNDDVFKEKRRTKLIADVEMLPISEILSCLQSFFEDYTHPIMWGLTNLVDPAGGHR